MKITIGFRRVNIRLCYAAIFIVISFFATQPALSAPDTPGERKSRSLEDVFGGNKVNLDEIFSTEKDAGTTSNLQVASAVKTVRRPEPTSTTKPEKTTNQNVEVEDSADDPMIKIVFHDESGSDEVVVVSEENVPGVGEQLTMKSFKTNPDDRSNDPTTGETIETSDSQVDSGKDSQLYAEALKHIASGNLAQAEHNLRLLVNNHPKSSLAAPGLFEMIKIMKNPDEQISWCNYFLEYYGHTEWAPRVYMIKGDILFKNGYIEEAKTAYLWASLSLPDPNDKLKAVAKRLAVILSEKKYDELLHACEDTPVPDLASRSPEIQYYRLKALLGLERWDQSLKLSDWMVTNCQESKRYPQALLTKATLLEAQEKYADAERAYGELLKLLPAGSPESELIRRRIQKFSEPVWPLKTQTKIVPEI